MATRNFLNIRRRKVATLNIRRRKVATLNIDGDRRVTRNFLNIRA